MGDLASVTITRLDDRTRFLPPGVGGSSGGQYTAPYLNLWITDGSGHFAIAADAPTEPGLMALYNNGYDLSFANLQASDAYIYESNLPGFTSGTAYSWASLAGFLIEAPSVAQLATLAGVGGSVGTGAPRDLSTNVAYGVNWVFGDTLSNYVTGRADQSGYIVSGAEVTAIPEPGTFVLLGAGMIALGEVLRRRRA